MAAFAVAAWCLGQAVQVGNGTGKPTAFAFLTAALILVLAGLALPSFRAGERWGERAVLILSGLVVIEQVFVLMTSPPAMYLRLRSPAEYAVFLGGVGVCAVVAGAAISDRPWLGRAAFPALLAGYFGLGLWLLRASPAPHIDVWVWHNEAIRAVLGGHNPWSGTMPDIYGTSAFYGPGLLVDGRVQTGFPYPPLSLGVSALGHVVAGDYRYANLVAMTGTGALLAYARPSRLSFAGAAIFLFTPRWLFVLEQGWTDVYSAFFLALSLFVAARWGRRLPWALGLWLAVKQYVVLALPLMPLLWPRPFTWRSAARKLGVAAGIAAVLTLPFALFDAGGFWSSLIAFQARQPFRMDALSYLALAASQGYSPPLWLGFALLIPACALAWWRAPRTESGFAASVALLYLCFFAFAKQAFCNYYFFIIAALCAAVAAARAPSEAAR